MTTSVLASPTHRPIYITPHFRWEEFTCHDGTPVPDRYMANTVKLCEQLEVLRKLWGKPITILSGYRSPSWNRKMEGATNSQHLRGAAADITVAHCTAKSVADCIESLMARGKIHNGGLGRYKGFTHVDVRAKPARW